LSLSGTPEGTLLQIFHLIEHVYAGNAHRMLYTIAKTAEVLAKKTKFCILQDMFLKVCTIFQIS
jgi:hypothetical protein